ncbi:MAG: hypothetical protein HY898_10080 [Deltaproteobacteria bacterium]|nr:hypothetical protein [Deltaproteobacteria bacterium]
MRNLTAFVLVLAALGVVGCCKGKSSSSESSPLSTTTPISSTKSKTAQCKEMIDAINTKGKTVSNALDKFGNSKKTKADSDALAATLDTAADQVKALDLPDPTLKSAAIEYHNMLDKLATAAKDANSPVTSKRTKALNDLDTVIKTESTIVDKVNIHCGAI